MITRIRVVAHVYHASKGQQSTTTLRRSRGLELVLRILEALLRGHMRLLEVLVQLRLIRKIRVDKEVTRDLGRLVMLE